MPSLHAHTNLPFGTGSGTLRQQLRSYLQLEDRNPARHAPSNSRERPPALPLRYRSYGANFTLQSLQNKGLQSAKQSTGDTYDWLPTMKTASPKGGLKHRRRVGVSKNEERGSPKTPITQLDLSCKTMVPYPNPRRPITSSWRESNPIHSFERRPTPVGFGVNYGKHTYGARAHTF